MCRAPDLRRALWIVVMAWSGASGCIHNHYYGTALPGCTPGQTVATQIGAVCDVPSGQVVVSGPTSPRTISSAVATQPLPQGTSILANPGSRVVISQPSYGLPSIGQSSSRFRWRKPDPESLPIMKVEGAFDDSTVRQ